jgi:hypothetical protein
MVKIFSFVAVESVKTLVRSAKSPPHFNFKMPSISKVALAALASVQGANAWGVLGHATVAYVAQHYLNAATASWLVLLFSSPLGR